MAPSADIAADVGKEPQALSITLEAEFADPRQLERWWGPPAYPATVTRRELAPGGHVEYYMTGRDGDQPFRTHVRLQTISQGRTRMSIESVAPSAEAMEQLLAMGMEEGLTEAVAQIDAILAQDAVAS